MRLLGYAFVLGGFAMAGGKLVLDGATGKEFSVVAMLPFGGMVVMGTLLVFFSWVISRPRAKRTAITLGGRRDW